MKRLLLAAGLLLSGTAAAAELEVSVEIPRLSVAEYHKPYVAVWIEDENRKAVANLAVWYEFEKRSGEGNKWLKDLRQWWRRSGRGLDMPVDGISSASQAPGVHAIQASPELAPGHYRLNVEAAREVGGRELLSLEFDWPPSSAAQMDVAGDSELGRVALELHP